MEELRIVLFQLALLLSPSLPFLPLYLPFTRKWADLFPCFPLIFAVAEHKSAIYHPTLPFLFHQVRWEWIVSYFPPMLKSSSSHKPVEQCHPPVILSSANPGPLLGDPVTHHAWHNAVVMSVVVRETETGRGGVGGTVNAPSASVCSKPPAHDATLKHSR